MAWHAHTRVRQLTLLPDTPHFGDFSRNEISELPSHLFTVSSIKVLKLTGNRLSELPEAIGGLTSLVELVSPGNWLRALRGGPLVPDQLGRPDQSRQLLIRSFCDAPTTTYHRRT